jgi:hypothetical protein
VAFCEDGNQLVVGCGDATGDQLRFYNVDPANGAPTTPSAIANSTALYGSAPCALNSITVLPPPSAKVIKTLRSALPHPVASGKVSMADFVAELRKKQGK